MDASGIAALSQLIDGLRGHEEMRITRNDFETIVKRHFSGSHAEQQITQLWEKICGGDGKTVGQTEVCSFLLREMQQRESQARAHSTLPLPHHPSFSSTPNSKETVCAVLPLPSPPQYLSVCKDGSLCVWTTRFQLQQTTSISGGKSLGGKRRSHGPGAVWVTSCVLACDHLVMATTGRMLCFYDTASLSCLHKLHKLPCVPLCLAYGREFEESTSAAHLVWGDENGCVGILSFSQPNKSLFLSPLITFNQVIEHAPLVTLHYEQAHSDWVCQVGWTGPSHCIISAAQSPTPSLLIQHVRAQRKQYIFKVRMGISCFAYSHKLEVLATGSLDHTVRLWTPFSPRHPVAHLSSHTAGVVGVVIAEHQQHLFSLAQDLSLCVWDIREHNFLQTISVKFPFTQRLPDFGPSPLTLLLLPSPTLTVTCNEYIARFTLAAGAPYGGVSVDTGHTHPVCSVVYCPLLGQLVSGCEGGEVRVWEVNSGRCLMKIEGCHGDQELTALAVDSGGSRILTGSRLGSVKVWEYLTGQCLQSLNTAGGTEVVSILQITERRRFMVTGWNRTISVFEDKPLGLTSEPAWKSGTPHSDDIITMDFCSPHYLATGSFDGLTVVWNTDIERVVSQFHSMRRMGRHTSSHIPTPAPSYHTSQCPTPASRPASRRLSSYRLKSASSVHLHHVPVDKILFLKTRVKSKVMGQGTLVSSEGGYGYFWDMFSSGPPLGRFRLTPHTGEVVLALAVDEMCQRLLAGDTAGHLTIFNIQHFCTATTEEQVVPEAECAWQAHDSEILSVTWTGPGCLVSASADHTVRMWTTSGQYVGYFGQQQSWSWADPTTFQTTPAIPARASVTTVQSVGEGEREVRETESDIRETSVDTPTEEISALNDGSLGTAYQTGVMRRMTQRLERRTHISEVDTSAISRGPAQYSPFQALRVQDLRDVEVPADVLYRTLD